MKNSFTTGLLLFLVISQYSSAASTGNALDVLLLSSSIPERRAAYLDILKNPRAYSSQIVLGLDNWREIRDLRGGIEVLNKLIYLAAALKRDEFIKPLVNIAGDPEYTEHECIYYCPPVFALAALVVSKHWAPPVQTENRDIPYLHEMELLLDVSLFRTRPGIYFRRSEDQKLLSKMETFSEKELIKQADPFNNDRKTRGLADVILSCTVVDDKNIIDLYWLAIEEQDDAISRYRGSICGAILRAEKAKAIKGD